MSLFTQTEGSGPRIALAHGFTQTRLCWGAFATDLATDHELTMIDLPGHGHSALYDIDLWAGGKLLAETVGVANYVGYSMGGRMLLHTALAVPHRIERLVLIGAHPGIIDPQQRIERQQQDETQAAEIVSLGTDHFLDQWLHQPMFRDLPAEAQYLEQRQTNRSEGLASSLRYRGTGTQDSLWERLGELMMPVLLIAGDTDPKYVEISRQMAERIPQAEVKVLPAGHAVHLEQSVASARLVREFVGKRLSV